MLKTPPNSSGARAWMVAQVAFVAGVVTSLPARADPCHAVPDKGATPPALLPGRAFSGPVVYVGDGDSLCVALGSSPAQWAEVRLADFYAPELHQPGGGVAKAMLVRIVLNRRVQCVAQHRSHDRVVARCELNGRSLGDLLRAAGASEGGNGRRERP